MNDVMGKFSGVVEVVRGAAVVGADYLEQIAIATLRYQGYEGCEREAWAKFPAERRHACIRAVSVVMRALHDEGWSFVPPPRD